MTDLDAIFSYFVEVLKCDPEREKAIDKNDHFSSGYSLSRTMFGYFVDYYGKNGFPTILKSQDYESVELPEVYHGFMEFDHGANLLTDWKYHYGTGYSHGLYFTPDREKAIDYTMKIEDGVEVCDEKKVLKTKINSDNYLDYKLATLYRDVIRDDEMSADIISDVRVREKLQKMKDFIETIDDKDLRFRFTLALSNPSTIAVYLGYDYLKNNDIDIVLNREILLVDENEYTRFKYRSFNHNYISEFDL